MKENLCDWCNKPITSCAAGHLYKNKILHFHRGKCLEEWRRQVYLPSKKQGEAPKWC